MPLLNNDIKASTLRSQLKALAKENSLDLLVGAMPVKDGTFLLLFSHRFNKEIGVTVNHGDIDNSSQIVSEVLEILGGLNAD